MLRYPFPGTVSVSYHYFSFKYTCYPDKGVTLGKYHSQKSTDVYALIECKLNCFREYSSVGRNITFYMQELKFELEIFLGTRLFNKKKM
jgi:hypothetical protein